MIGTVRIPGEIIEAVVGHARFAYPEEACGLVAGSDGEIRMVYCLTNRDRSPYRYTIDPTEHFHAMRHAERVGLEIRGVFHSHPRSAPLPSLRDVELAPDPEWIYLIVGNVAASPSVKAFEIRGGSPRELVLEDGERE